MAHMEQIRSSCGHMDNHPQNDWDTIKYDARFDVYWLPAGAARQQLFYCPWCGERLPPSQMDRWYDELEAAGIDPHVDPIPEAYQSGHWRGEPLRQAPPHYRGAIEGRFIDLTDFTDAANDDA
jgi:hypothetical protein